MADISCAVCGEPYESCGVYEAMDMEIWEAKLFLKGYGCPCCKGKPPEHADGEQLEMQFMRSCLDEANFDGEPIGRILEMDESLSKKRPWVKPDPVIITCAKCGFKDIEDLVYKGENEHRRWYDQATPANAITAYGRATLHATKAIIVNDAGVVEDYKTCGVCEGTQRLDKVWVNGPFGNRGHWKTVARDKDAKPAWLGESCKQ